jgi:ubiquinone biosynthesis protein COQ9
MTARSRKRADGAKRPRANAVDPKNAVLAAALVHVPFDGFTDSLLARAADEAGVSRAELRRLFPDGPLTLVEVFSERADAEMVRELAAHKLASLKIRERIALAVKTRIAASKPYKEAARRAAAFLTLPPHAATGVKLLYRTVDAIWRAIGDTSTDFNFYTKRAILAGVYSTTLLRWFADTSADERETDEFLRRRIDDVMRFEKFKAQIRERTSALPSLSDILNPDRRGPAPGRSKGKAG